MHYGSKSAKNAVDHVVTGYFMDSQKTQTQTQAQVVQAPKPPQQSNFLTEQRLERHDKSKQKLMKQRMDELQKKIKDIPRAVKDEDEQIPPPVDYKFQFGFTDTMDSKREQELELPRVKDGLYVIKPIE